MVRVATLLSASAGLAAGTLVTAWATGRPRRPGGGLGPAIPPEDLPPARIVTPPGRGEMFVRDQPGPADGPTILLLHGWVASADLNWFTCYGPLGEVGRVIAPDHRGHGRGGRHSEPFRLADVADDVAALLRHEGVGPVVAVGYSMGGPIAQLLWQRHPDLVSGLVLCATASHFQFSTLTSLAWRGMVVYQFGSRLLPRVWMEQALLAQTQGTAPVRLMQSITPEAVALAPKLPWAVGEIQRGDVEDLAEAGRELGRFDSRGWLGGADVPVAIVVTTLDRLVPPSAQLGLADLVPEPLVLEVAADHDAPASRPVEFARALVTAVGHVSGADVRGVPVPGTSPSGAPVGSTQST